MNSGSCFQVEQNRTECFFLFKQAFGSPPSHFVLRRAGAVFNLRCIFGTPRKSSEFGVQEFDRVIVERRCHVISIEGNLNVFHF